MAYQIQYGKPSKKERLACIQNPKKLKIGLYITVFLILLSIGLLGRLGKLDFLIPGDKQITKEAFHAMVEEVREGESVKEAITAFCEEILAGAEYKG